MASTYPSPRNERWVTPFPLIKDLSGSREDSGAPSDQARVLGIFSPFGGGKGADRERLVCDHREYIDGTRDRDADFGEEAGRNDNASPAPQTPRRRPRMTVAAHKDSSPQPQSTEELVEQDGEAESKSDDDRDEDYNDAAEVTTKLEQMTRVLTQPPSLLVSLLHLVLCHPLTGVQCLYPKNVPNKRLQLRSVQQRKKARARTMEIRHRQLAFNRRATLDQVGKRQCGTEADAKGRLRNTIHQDESELPAPDSEDESPALGSEDDDIEVVTGMLDAMVIDAGVETEISDGDPDIASEVKNRVSNKGTEGIPMDSDDIDETITELNLFETTVEAPNVNEFESLQSAELEGGEATGGRMEAKETALSAGLTGVEGVTAAIPSEVGTVVAESMNTAAADLESETHVTNVRQTEAPPYGVQPSLDTTQEQPSFGGENGQKDEMSSVKDNDSMAGKMWISCRVVDVRSRRC
nr:hypothetical protein PF009_g438 [Phytophthora fragariae]